MDIAPNLYKNYVKCYECGWYGHKDELDMFRCCPVCGERVTIFEKVY